MSIVRGVLARSPELGAHEEREKPEYSEKNLSEQGREPTNMTPSPGIEPWPPWWEASALTIVPALLTWHSFK